MTRNELPEELLFVECPDCGRKTSSALDNFKLQTNELDCPWCTTKKTIEDIVAKYERVEVEKRQ